MNRGMTKTITGQVLLIICCVFYLIWWSISYRPGESVNRLAGVNGILLLITAISGLSGVILSLFGLNTMPIINTPKLNSAMIIGGGITLYILLLLITYLGMKRPVTTELVLITGWLMLETAVINSMNGAGILRNQKFFFLLIILIAAFVLSMILYVLYYRMEAWKAFYCAMIPLMTEAVSMLAVILISIF